MKKITINKNINFCGTANNYTSEQVSDILLKTPKKDFNKKFYELVKKGAIWSTYDLKSERNAYHFQIRMARLMKARGIP